MSKTSSKTYNSPHLIAILGPTGVGKSQLAIELAERFDAAVLNADSRQFYSEMRIGTARPSPSEEAKVPHHFFGDRSVEEPLSAGRFEKEAIPFLNAYFQEKRSIFLVGGSGLYVDALLDGIDEELPPSDPKLREDLDRTLQEEGEATLLKELEEKDPVHYERIDQKNLRRVIRALEVIRATGRPFSSFRNKKKKERAFNTLKIGLWEERKTLHRWIGERVDRMMQEGLLEEVQGLLPYRDRKSLQTVGYQEFFPYFDGEMGLEEAKEKMERNTRRYAKRQMTWFRKDPEIAWFKPREKEGIRSYIEERTGLKGRSDRAPSDT